MQLISVHLTTPYIIHNKVQSYLHTYSIKDNDEFTNDNILW